MSGASNSCPNSPRRSRLSGDSSSSRSDQLLKGLTEDEVVEAEVGPGTSRSLESTRPPGIHRSASTTNAGVRPLTAPAGLYSYTGKWVTSGDLPPHLITLYYFTLGSAPTSVHGSLVNLNSSAQGSAIYVGYIPSARGSVSASSFSLNNKQRSGSQISVSSSTSPAASPQSSPRRVRTKKSTQ